MTTTLSPLQIFRTGRHTAMSGATLVFSDAHLVAAAAAYDPAKHEAPIVVGHPESDHPAYGWVKSLAFADGGLDAEPCQLDPDFAELVRAGRFKKISAAFYAPESPSNPVPGIYYLRHVGFLGAHPPAVKGLRDPGFAADEQGVVEFADWGEITNAGLWRSLRDWMIGQFGLDVADQVIPSDDLQSLEMDAAQPECNDMPQAIPNPLYAENALTPEQTATLHAENAQLKTDLAAALAAARAEKEAQTRAEIERFAEGLIAAGRLLPAQKPVVVEMLAFLSRQEAPVEFGEGEHRQPLAEAFQGLLGTLPVQIEFAEVAKRTQQGGVDLNDPVALAAAAQQFQASEAAAGRRVSIAQAVAHLSPR